MKQKILIFLNPFRIENPTREQQTEFLYENMMASNAFGNMGDELDYKELPKTEKELITFIKTKIREEKPEWIIATELSATVLAAIKIPNRILINPAITFNDLNNVPDHVRQTTHGFFSESHEDNYTRFSSVYPNSMLTLDPEVDYETIAALIKSIITDKE